MRRRDRARGAFTLFEVLGVVFVTALILGFATDYYIDLSRASSRALDTTREVRRSAAILDRIARDFESAMLLSKPPELDPLFHPWFFYGEARRGDLGADHIKFITRNFQPRRSDSPESDLTVVAYTVVASEEDDSLALYRWTSPRLPEGRDLDFPPEGDEASFLLADDLAAFGVTFYSADGETKDHWDSTTLLDSSALPEYVEIAVSLADPDDPDADLDDLSIYHRRVYLPMRPFDMATLLDPESRNQPKKKESDDEDDEDEDTADRGSDDDKDAPQLVTVADCVDIRGWLVDLNARVRLPAIAQRVEAQANRPWHTADSIFDGRMFDPYILDNPDCL